MKLYEELQWRGLIDNISNEELIKELNEGQLTFYIGFDPSASSLHIGHLCSLLTAKRLQQRGHKPLLIAGGATGLIGDPKPKAERPMIGLDEIKANIIKVKDQLEKIVPCLIINNYDWHGTTDFITYLRDYGKHFNVNYMLSKETVKSRLEVGITYTEFSYMILQAVDYLKLYETYNCRLQIGGQDQWGNITAGLELIRKLHPQAKTYALTIPLITKADGSKFGKTETGTVWLDSTLTSPYELYQYFINTEDTKVISYLKQFTFLNPSKIMELEEALKTNPELREAQKCLAKAVVTLIHGEGAYEQAVKISTVLFNNEFTKLTEPEILMALKNVPTSTVKTNLTVVELLVHAKIVNSKREARELIRNGAIAINGNKIIKEELILTVKEALYHKYLVIKRGKKQYFLIKIIEEEER